MGKKANAGRFAQLPDRNYLKSYPLDFAQTRKDAENQFSEAPLSRECIMAGKNMRVG